jgi:hypothetical protein
MCDRAMVMVAIGIDADESVDSPGARAYVQYRFAGVFPFQR